MKKGNLFSGREKLHACCDVLQLLGFMYGWLTFYHQGHEVANEFKPYMRELQFKIQKVRSLLLITVSMVLFALTRCVKQFG